MVPLYVSWMCVISVNKEILFVNKRIKATWCHYITKKKKKRSTPKSIEHLLIIVWKLDKGEIPLSTEWFDKFIEFCSIIHNFQFETIYLQGFGCNQNPKPSLSNYGHNSPFFIPKRTDIQRRNIKMTESRWPKTTL